MHKEKSGFWDLPLERRDNKPLPSQDGMPGQFLGSTVKERTRYVLSIIHILEASAENLICLFSLFGLPHFPFVFPPFWFHEVRPAGDGEMCSIAYLEDWISFVSTLNVYVGVWETVGKYFFPLCFWHFRQNYNVTKLIEIQDRWISTWYVVSILKSIWAFVLAAWELRCGNSKPHDSRKVFIFLNHWV